MAVQEGAGDQQPTAKVQADDAFIRPRTNSKPGHKRPIVDYEVDWSNTPYMILQNDEPLTGRLLAF